MNSLFYSSLMSSLSTTTTTLKITQKKKLNFFSKSSINDSNSHYRYLYLNCITKKNSKIMSLNNFLLIFYLIVNIILSSNCATSNKIRSKQIFNKTNEFNNYNNNNNKNKLLNTSYNSNDDDIDFITTISSQSSYNIEQLSYNKMLEFNMNSKFDNNNYNNNNNNNNNNKNKEKTDQIQQQKENDNHEDIDTYNRELFDQLTTSNPCLVHYCPKGRECILDTETNQPKCICLRYCSHRKRPICGSNGQIYENHCELHRASCLQGTPITYQRMENCFQLNNKNMDDNIQLNDEISNDFKIFQDNLNTNTTSRTSSNQITQRQIKNKNIYNNNNNNNDDNNNSNIENNNNNNNNNNSNNDDNNYEDNVNKKKSNKNKLYNWLHKTKKISTSSIPIQHEQFKPQEQHSLQQTNPKQTKVIKSKMKKCPSKLINHNNNNNNNDKNSNNNYSNNNNNNNDCLNGHYINHNNHNHNHNHNHNNNNNKNNNNNYNTNNNNKDNNNFNNNYNKNNNDGVADNINTGPITESNHETIVIYQETMSYSAPTTTSNYNKMLTPTATTIKPILQKQLNRTNNKNNTISNIPKPKYLTDLFKKSNIKYNSSDFNTINNINQKQQQHMNENISKNIQKNSLNYVENNGNISQQRQTQDQQKIQQQQQQQQGHNTLILNNNKNYYCTSQEYEIMKDNLLLYSHARLMSQDNNHSKDFLVSVMFSHYDQNNDAHLEYEELNQITIDEHLDELSVGCVLTDMLNFDDNNQDGKLSINEFYQAFSKLYSVSVVSLDKALETNHLSARVGDNVEIKCDVTGTPTPPLIWRRNGIELSSLNEDEIRVYSDGSLYLTRIQLYHSGNYSCHAQRNKDIVQTHMLSVYTVPQVRVTPRIQSKRPGENAEMFCHVIGDPFPKVEWLKNDESINFNIPDKYKLIGNGTALHILNIAYSDTGAYMCQASNVGIAVRDISSLIVQEEPAPTVVNEERKFFVFYDYGIAVYEPSSCGFYHQIQSDDIIPGTQEYVCGSKTTKCSWGRAINVGTRYIYATQPTLNRIIVISTIQMVVIEVLLTDKYPVELFYVPRLDQVWILCWKLDTTPLTATTATTTTSSSTTMDNNEPSSEMMKMMLKMMTNKTKKHEKNDEILKTIQVIRDADKKRKHHVVHPEPIDGQFDLIKNLFLPSNDLEQPHYSYNYGYVTHKNQRGLYKLDLQNLRYTKSVDLTLYNCVPEKVEFSALYGFVIMSCREPVTNRPQGQIVLDYLTDAILTTKPSLIGLPKISPDSRHIVTVQHYSDGVVIIVQKIKATGLEFLFDVRTTLNISDLTFYESQSMHGYDLFASAADKEDILYLNLFTGKVEMITGVGTSIPSEFIEWGNSVRTIKSSGLFGQYMATPSETAIFIINGRSRTINCEIGGILHSTNIVWSHNIPSSLSLISSSPSSSSSSSSATSVLAFTGNENTFKSNLKQPTESTLTQSISSSISSSSISSVIKPNEIVNPVPVLNIHSDDQATILL